MGRPLVPTQSMPTFGFDNSGLFHSSRNTLARAQDLISKERLRERELQPFGSLSPSVQPSDDVNALSLSPRTRQARLQFGPDGAIDELALARGTKRATFAAGEEEEGEATDTDSPEQAPQPLPPVNLPNVSNDFPPVFESANLTHPELFTPGSMGPPPVPNRLTRGLPARGGIAPPNPGLGRAASAPVGRLGGTFAFGMDVDGADEEDGFNVAEWAENEQF